MLISKKYFAVFMVMIFFIIGHAEATTKRYHIKSGTIKFNISGQNTGTEELYWSNFGDKEARYTETTVNIFGIKQKTSSISFMDGDWAYTYDPKNKYCNQNQL